jgi:3-oxoacyl-[acyl-carrier protein] reductase
VGGQAIAVQGDVTDPGDVETRFKRALATFGGIDVVVHAAGKNRCEAVRQSSIIGPM